MLSELSWILGSSPSDPEPEHFAGIQLKETEEFFPVASCDLYRETMTKLLKMTYEQMKCTAHKYSPCAPSMLMECW